MNLAIRSPAVGAGDRVSLLSPSDVEQLRPWLLRQAIGSHRFLKPHLARLPAFWADEIELTSRTPGAAIFCVGEAAAPQALLAFVPLPWESEFFAAKSASLRHLVMPRGGSWMVAQRLVAAAVEHGRNLAYQFLSARTYADELMLVHSLEASGFYLTDTLVDWVWERKAEPKVADIAGYRLRLAGAEDRDATLAMVEQAFPKHFGRFQSDPKISAAESARFYPSWIRSAFTGYADAIMVAESLESGEIAGCTLWKSASLLETKHLLPIGHYSLGGVAPQHAGRGLFQQLTIQGLLSFPPAARFISGPTHVLNHPVQAAYGRLGFRHVDARYGFHLWLNR